MMVGEMDASGPLNEILFDNCDITEFTIFGSAVTLCTPRKAMI